MFFCLSEKTCLEELIISASQHACFTIIKSLLCIASSVVTALLAPLPRVVSNFTCTNVSMWSIVSYCWMKRRRSSIVQAAFICVQVYPLLQVTSDIRLRSGVRLSTPSPRHLHLQESPYITGHLWPGVVVQQHESVPDGPITQAQGRRQKIDV